MLRLKQMQIRRGRGIVIGLAAGFVGFLLSLPLRTLFPGRLAGDPLPTMLILNQMLRSGLVYIQWRPFILHLLFLLLLISLVWGIFTVLPQIRRGRGWFVRSTRVAVLLNVVIAALFEVDSVMVAFWYIVSGYLSATIVMLIAGRIAGKMGLQRG